MLVNVNAWHNIEHSIIAQIAEMYTNKLSIEKVHKIVELIGDKYPTTKDYLSAACWADEVKSTSEYNYTKAWHFTRTPYTDDKTSTSSSTETTNAVMELNTLYKEMDQNDISQAQSMKLRWLIHIIGDIHQPLHNMNYFSAEYLSGDLNGNLFFIQLDRGNNTLEKVNLHFYTDSAGEGFSNAKDLPFENEIYDEIVEQSKILAKECEDMTLQGFEFSPQAWSEESYGVGVELYKAVNPMNILSEDQITMIQKSLRKQICKAGKRLALTYESIYDEFPPPSDFYFILIGFLVLLGVVMIDELYHGGSCSKQRREYLGIENNKKRKVKFDFGNSKV